MSSSRADATRPIRRMPGPGRSAGPHHRWSPGWWCRKVLRGPSGRASVQRILAVLSLMLLLGTAAAFLWSRPGPRGKPSGARGLLNDAPCAGAACRPRDPREVACGPDTSEPCNIDHATARCDQADRCAIAACYQSFADCDGNPTNGCEIDLRLDPDHCGRCDERCPPLEHAERGCGGHCTIWRCARGFRDCNEDVSDGCEVDVTLDPRHCGRCGHGCGGRKRCEHGRCV